MLDYGFDVLGFDEIEQNTHETNLPYRALMRSMGLERFGERQKQDAKGVVHWAYTVNQAQWHGEKAQVRAQHC